MKALSLPAGMLIAALFQSVTPVGAADLDYRSVPPPDRYGSAYDDPRYRDLYGPEPPRAYTYAPEPYGEPAYRAPRYAVRPPGPVPPGYVYGAPYPGRRSYRDDRFADNCLARQEVRQRLSDDGWFDLRHVDGNRTVAKIDARRRNGDLFRLKVDRCTGEVLKAVLLERYGVGPYANRNVPYRYERRYY